MIINYLENGLRMGFLDRRNQDPFHSNHTALMPALFAIHLFFFLVLLFIFSENIYVFFYLTPLIVRKSLIISSGFVV